MYDAKSMKFFRSEVIKVYLKEDSKQQYIRVPGKIPASIASTIFSSESITNSAESETEIEQHQVLIQFDESEQHHKPTTQQNTKLNEYNQLSQGGKN